MANTIKIKAGSGTPTTSNIVDRELAFDRSANKLYINDSGTIVDLTGSASSGDIEGVTAGVGLSGGGSSGTVSLAVDLSELTDMTASVNSSEDELIILDNGADRRKLISEIPLSAFNNDSGFITSTLTTEQVQDIVGAMFSSNTETRITATYQDSDGTIDLVVDDLDTDTQLTTENVQDIVGAMFSSNTETRISATYQDGDGTIDLVVDDMTADTNTTYTGGTNLTLSGTTFNVDDAFLINSGNDSTSGTITAAGFTTSGSVTSDTLVGNSNNTNTLLFDDDQSGASNMVTLQSINHINIMTDGNNNGTGDFRVYNGSYDTDTADLAFQVNSAGKVNVYDDLRVPSTISHSGDTDTYISFTNNRIRLYAGGSVKVDTDDTYLTSSGILDQDDMSSNSATAVASQQSIKAYVDAEVAGIVNSAPAALNTLDELAAALGDDANFATTTSTSLGNRLRVDTASQGLTGTQQANAITNLGITATKAELNYVDGVTSAIQTQLDAKLTSSSSLNGSNISSGTVAAARIANLAASKITSGTFDAARIPSLATSKITSGTFDSARMPATFGADSKVTNDITSRIDSGFHETATGTNAEGFPLDSSNYQHILAVTHSNNNNYYSMQIGGSFFDQSFYGRKTNNSGTQSWVRFITTADEGSGNGFDADTLDGSHASAFLTSANYTNGSNNRILTSTSSTGINGEGNLTFDGTNLTVAHSSGAVIFAAAHATDKIQLYSGGNEKIGTEANTMVLTAANFKFRDTSGDDNLTFDGTTLQIDNRLHLDGTTPFIRIQESGVTNTPEFWFGVDGGNLSLRLNNTGTYPLQVITDSDNDAVDSINLGYNTTVQGNVTLNGIVLDGNTITGVDDSGEFTDNDAHIMTSAAVNDRISSVIFNPDMNNVTMDQLGVNVSCQGTDGRIDAGNDIVAFATSDKRLKENIKPLDNALDKVSKISGVSFDWKPLSEEEKKTIHGNQGHDVGVIAQEIEEVLPEVVTTRDSGYKAVKYEKIVPLLIEAIKELKEEIEELKK